jgi:glycosyltransferase involved in cell wall biosynthesis
MKVYLEPEGWMSLGIKRVANALRMYRPGWATIVSNPKDADLHIVHMVGNGQRQHWLGNGPDPNLPYAVVQYCLRTTELPNTKDWLDVWQRARGVWSYYDLPAKIAEDGQVDPGINFYIRPLGVDATFRPSSPIRKRYLIGTSGRIADTEGVRECYEVCNALGRGMFHLGPNLELGAGSVTYADGISDEDLSDFWSQCGFVAGLRRIEGFELPVLEGLMAGARPIVFDSPHYRQWFGEHAEYVPEVAPSELVPYLLAIMSQPVRVVTAAERAQVAEIFNWKTITEGFWEAIR